MKTSCRRGYRLKGNKCVRIKKFISKAINHRRNNFWNFIAGISGLLLGSWMIFYLKNNWGFIPAIIGALLLIWNRK